MAKNEKIQSFQGILEHVKTAVNESANDNAVKKVIDKLVNNEIEKRASLIEAGVELWLKTKSELDKCQPDIVVHTPTESEEGEAFTMSKSYSDAKMKERNSLREKVTNIQAALIQALGEKQDYNKLSSLVKK